MKMRTVTVREGEYLGPVDWSYDFLSHYGGYGGNKEEACERDKAMLRQLEESCEEWEATTDGGIPRCGWGKVLRVGMYDGWPYWRPVPSVLISGWLGASWHPFNSVSEIRRLATPAGAAGRDEGGGK